MHTKIAHQKTGGRRKERPAPARAGLMERDIPNSAMLSVLSGEGQSGGMPIDELGRRVMSRLPSVQERPQAQIPRAESEADRLSSAVNAGTPETVKAVMGRRMGADFSGVRFHTGAADAARADAMGARAYTSGADVYFGSGGFDAAVAAHELVHTAQQGMVDSGVQTMSTPVGGVQMRRKKEKNEAPAAGEDKKTRNPAARLMGRLSAHRDKKAEGPPDKEKAKDLAAQSEHKSLPGRALSAVKGGLMRLVGGAKEEVSRHVTGLQGDLVEGKRQRMLDAAEDGKEGGSFLDRVANGFSGIKNKFKDGLASAVSPEESGYMGVVNQLNEKTELDSAAFDYFKSLPEEKQEEIRARKEARGEEDEDLMGAELDPRALRIDELAQTSNDLDDALYGDFAATVGMDEEDDIDLEAELDALENEGKRAPSGKKMTVEALEDELDEEGGADALDTFWNGVMDDKANMEAGGEMAEALGALVETGNANMQVHQDNARQMGLLGLSMALDPGKHSAPDAPAPEKSTARQVLEGVSSVTGVDEVIDSARAARTRSGLGDKSGVWAGALKTAGAAVNKAGEAMDKLPGGIGKHINPISSAMSIGGNAASAAGDALSTKNAHRRKNKFEDQKKVYNARAKGGEQLGEEDELTRQILRQAEGAAGAEMRQHGGAAAGNAMKTAGSVVSTATGGLGGPLSFVMEKLGGLSEKFGSMAARRKRRKVNAKVANEEEDLDARIDAYLAEAQKNGEKITRKQAKQRVIKGLGYDSGKRKEIAGSAAIKRTDALLARAAGDDERAREAKEILKTMGIDANDLNDAEKRESIRTLVGERLGLTGEGTLEERLKAIRKG